MVGYNTIVPGGYLVCQKYPILQPLPINLGVNTKSGEKPAQNVTKLFQSRPGLRDTQAVDTKSGKKRVQNVTKLTYEDIKQRIPQEMSLR